MKEERKWCGGKRRGEVPESIALHPVDDSIWISTVHSEGEPIQLTHCLAQVVNRCLMVVKRNSQRNNGDKKVWQGGNEWEGGEN